MIDRDPFADLPRNRPLRILCVGEAMIELAPDGDNARIGVAGDTFNTAVYLRRFLPRDRAEVAYMTALGDDAFSDRIAEAADAHGLLTDHVARLPGRLPGLYAIETDADGERRFHYWRGEAAARDMFGPGGVDADAIAEFDLIYLSGITLAILRDDGRAALTRACAQARDAGSLVAFDSNYRPALWAGVATAQSAVADMLAITSVALPSRDDEAELFGDKTAEDAVARLATRGPAEVALKDGPSGPRLWPEADHSGSYPAAEDVVDTTAAGDSFNAGYVAARIAGQAPARAARFAHDVARAVVAHPGAIVPVDALPHLSAD